MRISTCRARIKAVGGSSARAAAVSLLLVVPWPCSCVVPSVRAPFPERPDTVVPGDLFGPFDGQVLDQSAGTPIQAALVLGIWRFEQRGPLGVPAATRTAWTLSRSDGTYILPRLVSAGGTSVLTRFTLVVYKAGFLGYRSDLRYEDRSQRRDFAQRNHKVRMERFPDGESHARHLVFLGGDPALLRAAQAEAVQAALELSEAQPPFKEPVEVKKELPPLSAASLLTAEDLPQRERRKRRFTSAPLSDHITRAARGPTYDSVHLRATGLPESHDAALRVWRPDREEEAEDLYRTLKGALSGARDLANIGEQAFCAFDGKRRIHGAVALVRQGEAKLVVEVMCGASLCDEESTIELLRLAMSRLPAGDADRREQP